MLIIDTGVLVATADRNDPDYQACRDLLGTDDGPLVTTTMVIAEAAYLINRQVGTAGEVALYDAVVDGTITVETLTTLDWQRIHDLVGRYADLRLGGTDASLIAIAERLNAARIATLDHRDFGVVRPAHVDAFDIVPRTSARCEDHAGDGQHARQMRRCERGESNPHVLSDTRT